MSPHNPASSFGELIRQRREQLGLSQTEVARRVEIRSPEFIGMVEVGKRPIPLDRVPALADALEFDRVDLCKAALAERHPILYDALFRGKSPK
jgi:transcriptional regulator with XRE-family HTH domain